MSRKKLFGLLARKPGLTTQEFQDHYRHPHGTMGLRISTLRDYVQSHQIECKLLPASQQRYESIAELWFENAADLMNFRAEPTMTGFLNDDEWRFVDMKQSKHFIGEEEVLVSGVDDTISQNVADAAWRLADRPVSIKLLQFFERGEGADWRRDEDRELGQLLRAFRHVRCHPTTPHSISPRHQDREPDFIGVRELWWPTQTMFERAVAAEPQAWCRLTEREGVHTVLARAERFR